MTVAIVIRYDALGVRVIVSLTHRRPRVKGARPRQDRGHHVP